jgi:hypothetical protein
MIGPFPLPDHIRRLHQLTPSLWREPPVWGGHANWLQEMVILREEEEKKRRRRALRLYENGLEENDDDLPELVKTETVLECDRLPVYGYRVRPGGDFTIHWSQEDLDERNTPPPPAYGPSEDTQDMFIRDMLFGDTLKVDKFVIYRHCVNLSASVATWQRGDVSKRYMSHLRSWRPFDRSKPGARYFSIFETAGSMVVYHIPFSGSGKKKKKSKKMNEIPLQWPSRPSESMSGNVSLRGFIAKHKLNEKLDEAVKLRPRPKIIKPSPKKLQKMYRKYQVLTAIRDNPGRSTKELMAILQSEFIECKEIGTKKDNEKIIVTQPEQQDPIPWTQQKVQPILSALVGAGKVFNRYAVNGIKIYYTNDEIFTQNSSRINGEMKLSTE